MPLPLAARHAAHVKAAMASGPAAVLVLGASHDLSAAVQQVGGGTTKYIRVTTAAGGGVIELLRPSTTGRSTSCSTNSVRTTDDGGIHAPWC
jgi:hypothetical protein